jgi:O-antigen ligase
MLFLYIIWSIGSNHLDTALFTINKFSKLVLTLIILALGVQEKFIPRILYCFLGALFISEILSFMMYFHTAEKIIGLFVEKRLDNVPFMMNYTQYATVLNIAISFVLYQLLKKQTISIIQKIFYALFILSSTLNLFILSSGMGYLLFLFSNVTVLTLIYKQQMLKLIIAIAVIFPLIYWLGTQYSPIFQKKSTQMFSDVKNFTQNNNLSTSQGVRLGFIFYSTDILKDNFLLGLGTGDHIDAVREQILKNEKNPKNKAALLKNIPYSHGSSLHNQFLDLVLQFGIIGLLVFFNIFYQIQRNKPSEEFLIPLPYILIVNLLIASFANPLFIYGDVEKIFILLVALLVLPFKQITDKLQKEKNPHAV